MSTQNPPPTDHETARILLVDDEWCIREVFSSSLLLDGYEVETAEDGAEALEKFESGVWDVVVTDRAMPRMDGHQLAAEIKMRRPNTPVIMMTGLCGESKSTVGITIDELLLKPFPMSTLREAIERVRKEEARLDLGAVRG